MRSVYVALLFLAIAAILFGSTFVKSGSGSNEIARKSRRRTAAIFVAVSVFLIAVDQSSG